jgi:iron complex outermembrane receptor protein
MNRLERLKKNYVFLLLVAVIYVNIVSAQSNVKDSIQLNEVVVTGSKIGISRKLVPLSVSQISQQDIKNSGQMNILPVLNEFVPGIFVTERNSLGFGVSTGGAGAITIRGISSNPNTDVLMLIDGNPQYQGLFGHPLPDAYVASDVEKVEIIRGPASLLYGSNAMAGVINIITKKQHDEGLKVNLGAAYGSYNTQKYYGTIGFKKDKLSAYASLNHDQTDGIRANTDFHINNGYAKVGYELNKNYDLIADFSIAKYNANDNGSIYLPPSPFNIDIMRGKASVSLENNYKNSEGALKIYHNFGTHYLSDGFHSTDRNSGAMLYQTFKMASNTNITVGTEFKQYGGMANQGFKSNSLITVNELALYAYAQQKLVDKFTLSAGLRLENNSKFGNELIPLGGLTYNLSDNTTFKASVSKGFRSPTIVELYLFAPNPDLQPERMMNYEISWLQSLLNNRLSIELTAFKVKGDNLIQVVVPPFPAMRQNVGSFDNEGIEFMAKFSVNRNLYLNANYNFLHLTKIVLAAPRQQVNVGANYRYKIYSAHLSAQYIDKLFTVLATSTTQSYLLMNVRLTAQPFKWLELFIAGDNLTNSQYQINYGYPMPGINFNTGVNIKL